MSKYNFVKQTGIKDCGVSCMAMIIKYYGGFINHERLSILTNTNKDGTSAYDIVKAFKEIGFNSYGIKYELNKLATKIKLPAIAHTVINNSYNHFVLIYEINFNKEYLIIADPADRIKKISFNDFNHIFTKNIIVAYPNRKIECEKTIDTKKYLFKYINKKYLFKSLTIIILEFILSIIYFFLLKSFIDSKKLIMSIYIPFILLLKFILNNIKNNMVLKLKNNTCKSLMNDSFTDLVMLPYSYYRNHTTGEIISRLNDIDNIKDGIDIIVIIITDLIITLITGVMLFIISKILFIITLFIVLLYLLNYFSKYITLKAKLQNLKQAKSIVTSYSTESIYGFESVKGQNLENDVIKKYDMLSNNYLNNLKFYKRILNRLNSFNEFISDLSIYLIVFVGLILINHKMLSYSELLIYYALLNYFIEPVFNMSNISLVLGEIQVSINRLIELKYNLKKTRKFKKGDIFIKNLNFRYKDNVIFDDLNLEINKGDKIALIGSSGSGKSTLLKILKQYYKTSDININDENINNIDLKNDITYISQDEYLFTDTLYNNIVLNEKIDKDDLNKIINICSLNDLINKNFLKMDMLIEENGFNLSGGEIERVILARALVHIKDFLFIDEGLSEVDVKLERNILKKLIKEYEDKTIIFVTHRKDNINLFDKVINLDSMNH